MTLTNIEWATDYCLDTIQEELDKTEELRKRLLSPGNCSTPLTFEEKWILRETLNNIQAQVSILRDDVQEHKDNPPKKTLFEKFWGLY